MIARGDSIAGSAIGDTGVRVLPGEWAGPLLPLAMPGPKARRRRFVARR